MVSQFEGVVLDLDGLLLDTERVQFEVGPEVLRAFGYEIDPIFFQGLVGIDRVTSIALINRKIGAAIDHAELDTAWNAAMATRMQAGIPLRPGVHAFLAALDRLGLPRAIATNSLTERARSKLASVHLLGRVDEVVGVDLVRAGKPAPDVYLEAARRIDLSPAKCAALDDSDLGVRAAMAAGMGIVIQVPDLSPSVDRLAHHEAASLDEARTILGI